LLEQFNKFRKKVSLGEMARHWERISFYAFKRGVARPLDEVSDTVDRPVFEAG
jgi:hypothetical protein